jgi:hypothetical protein
MADEDGSALLAEAERASLGGLSRDFSVLYEARSSGDVVFKFPAEGDELEERAHRCAPGCCGRRRRRGSQLSAALGSALLLTVSPRSHTHLRRLILGVRSKYFAALMARLADLSAPIVVTDLSHYIFQQVLKWVYTGA